MWHFSSVVVVHWSSRYSSGSYLVLVTQTGLDVGLHTSTSLRIFSGKVMVLHSLQKRTLVCKKKRQKRPSLCYLTLTTWFHLRTPLLAQCDIALHQHRRNRYVPVMEALQAELDNRENFCTKTNLISTKGTIFLVALSNIIDAILRNVLYILL